MDLFRRLFLVGFIAGCRSPPQAVGFGVSSELVNKATAWMARISTWRTRPFKRDVRLELQSPDGSGNDGWYDPDLEVLTLVDRSAAYSADIVLVHELTHALQDQHQNLGVGVRQPRSKDAELAWRALVEGEATLAAAELVGFDVTAHLSGAHGIGNTEQEATLFTYMVGAQYVASLRREGGWATVDAAWLNPPDSTAEIRRRVFGSQAPASAPPTDGPHSAPH